MLLSKAPKSTVQIDYWISGETISRDSQVLRTEEFLQVPSLLRSCPGQFSVVS